MRPIVTDVPWSVDLLVTAMSLTKTDEPIELPFGMWARGGPGDHVLGGRSDPPRGNGNFFLRGHIPVHCKV